jgi:hypothetical protein
MGYLPSLDQVSTVTSEGGQKNMVKKNEGQQKGGQEKGGQERADKKGKAQHERRPPAP